VHAVLWDSSEFGLQAAPVYQARHGLVASNPLELQQRMRLFGLILLPAFSIGNLRWGILSLRFTL
jgi:hypothetical protein